MTSAHLYKTDHPSSVKITTIVWHGQLKAQMIFQVSNVKIASFQIPLLVILSILHCIVVVQPYSVTYLRIP